MVKKYKITAMILAGCLCVSALFPETVLAGEDTFTEEAKEEVEISEAEAEAEEISETEELKEEVTEAPSSLEDEDPGKGRLNGDTPEEFYDGKMQTRAVSNVIHDSRFADYNKIQGIDVSKYNGDINWKKVKAAGIEFAFVRVGFRGYVSGGLGSDDSAATNMKNAAAAGVKVGAYIYSQAITVKEAEKEAEFILEKVKGYDITMPLVFDFEYYKGGRLQNANLSQRKQTDICLAFCKKIEAAGYTPLVYANKSMLTTGLYAEEISSKYPIWLAHYTNQTDYAGEYTYWQYTEKGNVDGITGNNGNVDMNYWYVKPESNTNKPAVPVVTGEAASFDSVKLTWKKVEKATGYRVFRYNPDTKKYERIKILTSGNTLSYTDTDRDADTTYRYKVRAYTKVDGKNVYGDKTSVIYVTTLNPVIGKITGTDVNVRTGPATTYARLTKVNTNDSVTILGSRGDWYKVSLKIGTTTKIGYITKQYVAIIDTPVLKGSAISTSTLKLSWAKVPDVNGYQIQRYNATKKSYVTIKTITKGTTVSYTNTGLSAGTTYKYRMRAYRIVNGNKIYSEYSAVKNVKTKK